MYNFCFDCYVLVVKGNEKDHNAQRKACVRNFKPWVPTVAQKGDGGDHSKKYGFCNALGISICLGFGVQAMYQSNVMLVVKVTEQHIFSVNLLLWPELFSKFLEKDELVTIFTLLLLGGVLETNHYRMTKKQLVGQTLLIQYLKI